MDRRAYLEDKILRSGDNVMWEMCVKAKVPTCCLGLSVQWWRLQKSIYTRAGLGGIEG